MQQPPHDTGTSSGATHNQHFSGGATITDNRQHAAEAEAGAAELPGHCLGEPNVGIEGQTRPGGVVLTNKEEHAIKV